MNIKNILFVVMLISGVGAASLGQVSNSNLLAEIIGKDTLCLGENSDYSVSIKSLSNKYLFRDTTAAFSGTNGFFALNAGNLDLISNTFSYDLWVKPTRTINMVGESNACAGDVSVPLANSNQNWALVPAGLSGGNMAVGLTIGTNGLMVGEHSGFILVSRLSYTIPITDWVHVAIVYRPDSIFLYLNGGLVRSRQTHCPQNSKFATPALTGYYYAPDFKGNIDEFRLWDIPLTPLEVMIIKDKKLVNQVSGLRYYASFDNGKFERTLGDLGTSSMIVSNISTDKHIKTSTWELNKYSGASISSLAPFDENALSYLWSTAATAKTITFSPNQAVSYLFVNAYDSFLTVSDTILITGKDCNSKPNWSVDPNLYSYDGEVAGQVFADSIPVINGNGILGAFVGEECRGVKTGGFIGPSGKYVFVLRCFSNVADGEPITFQYYDPLTLTSYSIRDTIVFESNMIIGDAMNPKELYAFPGIKVTKPLYSGWTWFSLNVKGTDMSVNTVLSSLTARDGDYIKSQTVSATYYNGAGWFGELARINPNEMYKIKLSQPDTLKFIGIPVDLNTHSISISNGWNWIGYLPQSAKPITEALLSISPVTRDYIKNQTRSSTFFEGSGWFGELDNLEPLDGYMLKTSHEGTLNFQKSLSGFYTDIRDGHNFQWIKIGWQVWLSENRAYLPGVSPSYAERYTSTDYVGPSARRGKMKEAGTNTNDGAN
jgi:hypothetical protein